MNAFRLLLCLLAITPAWAQTNATIRGTIANPLAKTVKFRVQHNPLDYPGEEIELPLDNTNSFVLKANVAPVARLGFKHGPDDSDNGFDTWILEPGDDVTLTADAKQFWKTLRFTGKNADKFNYYVADYVEADVKRKWGEMAYKNRQLPIERQFAYLDTIERVKLQLLEQYRPTVSPLFYKIWHADTKGMIGASRLGAVFSTLKPGERPSLKALTPSQQQFLYDMPAQSDTTALADMYASYLTQLRWMVGSDLAQISRRGSLKSTDNLNLMHLLYQGKMLERQWASETRNNLAFRGVTPETQQMFDDFNKTFPGSNFQALLQTQYDTKLAMSKGRPAFPFTLRTEQGNVVNLADYRGKIVYLDFWAHWCGPCIGEMKPSKVVKEHFKSNPDVVFLYISLDEEKHRDKWLAAIKQHEIAGTHLLAPGGFRDPVAKTYDIHGIPSYFVIDRAGRFFAVNPPRPSQGGGKPLIDVLEKALAEK